jgi:hypothetical protein
MLARKAAQPVSHPSYGLNQSWTSLVSGAPIHLAPEIVDVDIDDIGPGLGIHLPYLREQFSARDAFAGMLQQILKQRKLFGCEIDGRAGACDFVLDAVEFQIAVAKHRVSELLAAPQ